MAQRFEQRLKVVQSERFSNPVVRFRRIRGRVVPIVNRHRIGEAHLKAGGTIQKIGLGTAAVGLGRMAAAKAFRRVDTAKKTSLKSALKSAKKIPKFKKKAGFVKKLAMLAGKTIKTPKAMTITGGAIFAAGLGLGISGAITQSKTELGFDIGGRSE